MRRLLLLAAYVLALGCAPDTDSHYGIVLADETGTVTTEDVDRAVDHALTLIGGEGKQLDGLTLSVELAPLPLSGAEGPCQHPAFIDGAPSGLCAAGLSYLDFKHIRVWKERPCWARSAFVHELCHFFQLWRDDVDDVWHEDPKWWSVEGSVERQAQHAFILETCPDSP